jgi:hypothetical protein
MDLIFSANPLSDETSIALQKIVDVVTQESDDLNTIFLVIMICVVIL